MKQPLNRDVYCSSGFVISIPLYVLLLVSVKWIYGRYADDANNNAGIEPALCSVLLKDAIRSWRAN